eukprot:scaffold13558_cov177-Amphora_coffeaeformis.AAC.3
MRNSSIRDFVFSCRPLNSHGVAWWLFFAFVIVGTATAGTTTPASRNSEAHQECAIASLDLADKYKLLNKTKLSRDSCLLRFQVPESRRILGTDPTLPTCLKVDFPLGTDEVTGQHPVVLSKSYSPISHPAVEGYFELVVKEYPVQPGGGVGAFLCHLPVGESVTGTIKKHRVMHGSPQVQGRWNQVGLVAGGTGIAPLLQLVRILLASPADTSTRIHILSINRLEEDILMRHELDRLATDYPNRVFVTYSLTGEQAATSVVDGKRQTNEIEPNWWFGRGSVEMARAALPPSTKDGRTMIFVCGKDGFVSTWAGPVVRGPPKADGSKGPKIQGPLLGILASSGYRADEVFKY